MAFVFGKAEKKDAGRINELFMEMLQTIYHKEQVDGYEDVCLDKFFDGGENWISIANDGNQIVAFLSIEVHREDDFDYIYLDDFSVTEQYRGQGIGTQLVNRAEAYAKEIQISKISLHVEKSNTAAFNLYKKLGYRIYKEQGTRLLMVKDL